MLLQARAFLILKFCPYIEYTHTTCKLFLLCCNYSKTRGASICLQIYGMKNLCLKSCFLTFGSWAVKNRLRLNIHASLSIKRTLYTYGHACRLSCFSHVPALQSCGRCPDRLHCSWHSPSNPVVGCHALLHHLWPIHPFLEWLKQIYTVCLIGHKQDELIGLIDRKQD